MTELVKLLKSYEKISLIVVDDYSKIKSYAFENWFTEIFTVNEGLCIGRVISEQNLFRLSSVNKEMAKEIDNNMGYLIRENTGSLIKLIDFVRTNGELEEDK